MLFSDWRVLTRRWYVVLLGLIVTAALGAAVTFVVPPKYEATASVLLLPPKGPGPGKDGGNPFLALGGLDVLTGVLSRSMSDLATQQDVEQAGGTGTFVITPDPMAGGPVLMVTVDDDSRAGTLRTLDVVLQRLPETLKELQTSTQVPPSTMIRSKEITHDAVPTLVLTPLIRAILAAVAVGLVLTVLSAALADNLLSRRRAGKRSRVHGDRDFDGSQRDAADELSLEWSLPPGGPQQSAAASDREDIRDLERLLDTRDGSVRPPG